MRIADAPPGRRRGLGLHPAKQVAHLPAMPAAAVLLLLIGIAQLAAGEALRLEPPLLRLDLQPSDVVETGLQLRAPPGTQVTAVAVDCACLRLLTALPARVPETGALELRLRVTGVRPGIEEVLAATSAGIVRAQLQLVGPGAGRGSDQLAAALAQAQAQGWRLIAIAHDLRGQVRHCGCSTGALGGAGRLALLPATARRLAPTVAATWLLTGEADGPRAGLAAALAETGWIAADPAVRVAADPAPLLAAPGVIAVVVTGPAAMQHRRIVRPVLTAGMAVELLLIDAAGVIQARRTMPVDDSLADDPAIAARFRDRLGSTIDPAQNPSQACAACHQTAAAAWAGTRHAHALASLKPEDRTDGCIGCHVTPVAPAVVAPAVHCQSCHQGGGAHIASAGKLRTTGTVDCRSCHDARHHPTFRRETAWPLIEHGREPARP